MLQSVLASTNGEPLILGGGMGRVLWILMSRKMILTLTKKRMVRMDL